MPEEDPEPMPLPFPPTNENGSLRPYTEEEVDAMEIRHVGVRDGSHPTHRRRVNDNTIVAEYFCAYDALDAFICHMLGAAAIYTDEEEELDKLSRLLPQAYPNKTTFFFTSLDEAKGHRYLGEQEGDGRPIYEKWRCRFTAQQVPFLALPDDSLDFSSEHQRFVQELPSTAQSDYITLPGGVLRFAKSGGGGPTGIAIPHNIGFIVPAVQIKKKWIRIPYDAWRAGSPLRNRVFGNIQSGIEPWLGTINSQNIFGYSAGQLLLIGVEEELLLDPSIEDLHWNLTYIWLARSVSHNWFKFFDPAGANTGWYFVSNDGIYYDTASLPDGKSLFNKRDHMGLFVVGEIPPDETPPP